MKRSATAWAISIAGTSTYAGRIGQRGGIEGVTIVDDGTLDGRRGSLNIDDEGTRPV